MTSKVGGSPDFSEALSGLQTLVDEFKNTKGDTTEVNAKIERKIEEIESLGVEDLGEADKMKFYGSKADYLKTKIDKNLEGMKELGDFSKETTDKLNQMFKDLGNSNSNTFKDI